MKKFIVLSVLLCNACVSSVPLYTDTNGETVYEATAVSNFTTLGSCYKRAYEDCPNGFDVKDKDREFGWNKKYLIYGCKKKAYSRNREYQNQNYQYYK